jgi:hypothetical protein
MPTAIVKIPKQNQSTDVTVGFAFDSLVVSGTSAVTSVYATLTPPPLTIANVTVTAGTSGTSTLTTTTVNGFLYVPIGATITLSTAGGATLPASSVVTAKPNNTTLIINKVATANSTSAGSSTILATIPAATVALAKVQINLNGTGSSTWVPAVKTSYYDGSVSNASANEGNATETQTSTKSINMPAFLAKVGLAPTDSSTLDVSA